MFPPLTSDSPQQLFGNSGTEEFRIGDGIDSRQVHTICIPTHGDGGIVAIMSHIGVKHYCGRQHVKLLIGKSQLILDLLQEASGSMAMFGIFVFIFPAAIVEDGEELADFSVGLWDFVAQGHGVVEDVFPMPFPVNGVFSQIELIDSHIEPFERIIGLEVFLHEFEILGDNTDFHFASSQEDSDDVFFADGSS